MSVFNWTHLAATAASACSRFIVFYFFELSWAELSLSSLFQKFQHFVCHINIKYDFLSGFKCIQLIFQLQLPFPSLLPCLRVPIRNCFPPRLACGCQCGYLILFRVHIRLLKCVDVSYLTPGWLRALSNVNVTHLPMRESVCMCVCVCVCFLSIYLLSLFHTWIIWIDSPKKILGK